MFVEKAVPFLRVLQGNMESVFLKSFQWLLSLILKMVLAFPTFSFLHILKEEKSSEANVAKVPKFFLQLLNFVKSNIVKIRNPKCFGNLKSQTARK